MYVPHRAIGKIQCANIKENINNYKNAVGCNRNTSILRNSVGTQRKCFRLSSPRGSPQNGD